jgi:hypothetical protein
MKEFLIMLMGTTIPSAAMAADNLAPKNPSCLTKAEARAAYPNKYLYWHTANRCWDATPGRHRVSVAVAHSPAPSLKTNVIFPTMVVVSSAINSDMFTVRQMNEWPILYDIDEATSEPKDYCCWPPLERLEPAFNERWPSMQKENQ